MSSELARVAKAMVAPGKGILAADESTSTANKRFSALGLPTTEEMRRSYRDMLLGAPEFGSFISGVILYDETVRQTALDGRSFVDVLRADGSLPGIKLDLGPQPLPLALPNEKITEGLDGLPKRVEEYRTLGAAFAKWRAVITVDVAAGLPSDACLHANAHALARYAAICQAGGLVPIVEPEVVMDGGASQTLEQSFAIHERTLRHTFEELAAQNVAFEDMVLKPSMVIPGQAARQQKATVGDVAARTLEVLLHWVPAAVAGIAFLSGGQSDEEATAHLNEINVLAARHPAPWPLTFSYGRALQAPALARWNGAAENVEAGRKELHHRMRMNSLAALGKWSPGLEREKDLILSR